MKMFNIPGSNDILQQLLAMNIDRVPAEMPVVEEPSIYDKLNKAVSNPNTIRAMGQLAAGLGSGQNFAQASGAAADMTARNVAAQKAGSKLSTPEDFTQQLIKAIQSGNFFTPKGEAGPTNATINQDGVTLKLDRVKPAQKSPFGTDLPLEADTGGVDLRGFY
jgi:hypothetical protein